MLLDGAREALSPEATPCLEKAIPSETVLLQIASAKGP